MEKPTVFTEEEIALFRDEIARARRAGSYEPGRWSVGALNRDPRVLAGMPGRIDFRDATLRSIENMPGVVATQDERDDYLRQIVSAGVPAITGAGSAGRSLEQMRREVEVVKGVNPDCRVICPLILTEADLDRAVAAGFDGVQVWIDPFGPAAQIYRRLYDAVWSGHDWRETVPIQSREELLASKAALVRSARSRGLEVTTPLLMVSYLDGDNLRATVDAMVDAGVTELTLFDGPGAMGPEALGLLIAEVREMAPGVQIGVHVHNTFGLATSCAIAAARAGATVIELSVNGYCGGPGNADLASTAVAFEVLYGVRTGLDLGRLTALARVGEELTDHHVAWNHPITGTHAFDWGGMDIITQEVTVDRLLHNCVDPDLVGNRRTVPFTVYSGPFTLLDKLSELGIDASKEQVDSLLGELRKVMTARGSQVSDEEIASAAYTLLGEQ